MSQPYSAHQMNSGLVPPPSVEGADNTYAVAPVAAAEAAVAASIDPDDFVVQHAPNMAYPGTHATTGGVAAGGGND